MAKTVAIGIQSFERLVGQGYFYIDKTDFIREWWEGGVEPPGCRWLSESAWQGKKGADRVE